MNAIAIAGFVGALLGMLLLSRLLLWALKRMGDTANRIALAHGSSLCLAVVLTLANQSPYGPDETTRRIASYAVAALVWLAVDLVALRGRRVRRSRIG